MSKICPNCGKNFDGLSPKFIGAHARHCKPKPKSSSSQTSNTESNKTSSNMFSKRTNTPTSSSQTSSVGSNFTNYEAAYPPSQPSPSSSTEVSTNMLIYKNITPKFNYYN